MNEVLRERLVSNQLEATALALELFDKIKSYVHPAFLAEHVIMEQVDIPDERGCVFLLWIYGRLTATATAVKGLDGRWTVAGSQHKIIGE